MKLCFDKVSAAYRRNLILKDVSFGVPKGSLTVLVGLNGAGKSTLLRCLTGEKHDYQGRILLDGQDIRHFSPVQRAL